MTRTTSILASLAIAGSASMASAEEHVILYLGDAFFPAVSYVDDGDTIRIVNTSDQSLNIIADDEAWMAGPIAPNTEHVMTVQPGMAASFYDADATDEQGAYITEGTITFGEAPIG